LSSEVGYPDVRDEFETLDLILAGKSIARFGDGEFNLVRGGNCVSQRQVPGISTELRRVLNWATPNLLVGIPRLDPRSPKNANWVRYSQRVREAVNPKKTYYSAFITRPDSAPWIATDEYFDKLETLWSNKDVTMVYGSNRSLSIDFPAMRSANSISVVAADYAHTYPRIDELQDGVEGIGNQTVLLMCGPTATCLAARLSDSGYHAIDLGHIGMWWRPQHNPKLVSHLLYLK
jgi:hypothetical protein